MSSDARTSTTIDPSRIRKYTYPQKIKGKDLTLIKSSPHPTLPIIILNYSNDTERSSSWDDLTMAARVLVVERNTGKVVSRAFSKFFNWNEKHAYQLSSADAAGHPRDEIVSTTAEEKLDGSIITLFFYRSQWILTSKARFDSVHVEMAQEILKEKYPSIIDTRRLNGTLPRDKTYVFELIHPKNPTALRYAYKDLVLLSVIGMDGSEPPQDFNWSIYPFPRPKMNDINITDLDAVRRLNRVNEEGLVVKLYLKNDPVHPQRLKVKFESYLDLIRSKNYYTPAELAGLYRKKREMIYTFKEEEVRRKMKAEKEIYFEGVRRIADDFGGEKWVNGLIEMWNEVETVFVKAEIELRKIMDRLKEKEQFGDHVGSANAEMRRRFAQTIMKEETMVKHKTVLFLWFSGAPIEEQIKAFTASVKTREKGGVV
ncbi:RNA ligase-domain-containing protein [Lentinula edodes]|nr:RNA ligase-domain-containing protein [Lentinula edodes]